MEGWDEMDRDVEYHGRYNNLIYTTPTKDRLIPRDHDKNKDAGLNNGLTDQHKMALLKATTFSQTSCLLNPSKQPISNPGPFPMYRSLYLTVIQVPGPRVLSNPNPGPRRGPWPGTWGRSLGEVTQCTVHKTRSATPIGTKGHSVQTYLNPKAIQCKDLPRSLHQRSLSAFIPIAPPYYLLKLCYTCTESLNHNKNHNINMKTSLTVRKIIQA